MHLQSFAECSEKKERADASLFSSSVITNTCSCFNTKGKPIIVHAAQNQIFFFLALFPQQTPQEMQQPTLSFRLHRESWVENQNGVSFTCSPVEIISRTIPAEGRMAGLFQFGSFHSFTPNVHASIKKPSVAMFSQPLAPTRGSFKIEAAKREIMA